MAVQLMRFPDVNLLRFTSDLVVLLEVTVLFCTWLPLSIDEVKVELMTLLLSTKPDDDTDLRIVLFTDELPVIDDELIDPHVMLLLVNVLLSRVVLLATLATNVVFEADE